MPAGTDGSHDNDVRDRTSSRYSSGAVAAAEISVCTVPGTLALCSRSHDEPGPNELSLQAALPYEAQYITPYLLPQQATLPSMPEFPLAARSLLTSHALRAIAIAEDMMQNSDPLHMRRWFRAAVVYFEVIRCFCDVTLELNVQRQRLWRLSRLCCHLHENCVAEHNASSRSVTDVYELPADMILGRGSYGIVALAISKDTGEHYACKVLKFDQVAPQNIDRLHSEISSMRQLDHPNILRLRQVFFGHRRIHLIMDLCEGGELYELVNASSEHRTEKCATRFLTQMFSAVRYLHANGVMHRDLKLENWLFEQRSGSHLKLIDFGLARHFQGHERMYGAVGSMYYVAPEVLCGSYDARCDMWSLGVIAYMLVSGAPPFWGRSDNEVRSNILAGLWDFPHHFFSGVSSMAMDFISRLLQHDPERRMTAEEALSHPWLNPGSESSHRLLTMWQQEELFRTLMCYASANPLQKMILVVGAFHLTPAQTRAAQELFHIIDADSSGTISFDEFACALQSNLEYGTSRLRLIRSDGAHIAAIFNAIIVSRSSEITYTEFVAATVWPRIILDEGALKRVFNSLDACRDGRLNVASIKSLVGIDYNEDEVLQLIIKADADGDGYLDYNDFLTAFKSNIDVSPASGDALDLTGRPLIAKYEWKTCEK